MTAITRHLPWFLRDPAISVIGQQCYTSLVENLDVTDVACLKHSFSKGLGLGIVVLASIVKVPQLILILRARSAGGLSLWSYVLETLAYAITLAYSARKNFPFSTYGENFFLTMQNIVIIILVIYHSPPSKRANSNLRLSISVVAIFVTAYILTTIPSHGLAFFQISTIPLSLLSKIPQIYKNQHARSTGQLSSIAVLSQILGCVARMFTTATEIGDGIVLLGYFLALALNLVLGVQMYAFWGRETDERVLGRLSSKEKDNLERIIVPPPSPLPQQGGRRWARKVD